MSNPDLQILNESPPRESLTHGEHHGRLKSASDDCGRFNRRREVSGLDEVDQILSRLDIAGGIHIQEASPTRG